MDCTPLLEKWCRFLQTCPMGVSLLNILFFPSSVCQILPREVPRLVLRHRTFACPVFFQCAIIPKNMCCQRLPWSLLLERHTDFIQNASLFVKHLQTCPYGVTIMDVCCIYSLFVTMFWFYLALFPKILRFSSCLVVESFAFFCIFLHLTLLNVWVWFAYGFSVVEWNWKNMIEQMNQFSNETYRSSKCVQSFSPPFRYAPFPVWLLWRRPRPCCRSVVSNAKAITVWR